jgi:adenosylmethionine---8-amino-7-oxononanoate aminotransferase
MHVINSNYLLYYCQLNYNYKVDNKNDSNPMTNTLAERDHQHIWHPCSQMKDYETFKPLHIKSAKGPYIELADGTKIIDAISSWWCKPLGHGHPRLQQALVNQLEKFEHVIFANTCNETIVELSEKLTKMTKTLDKVFYAGDGSSAVEIAIKMSFHASKIKGKNCRQIMSLQNSYHGETGLALSVSDLGLYRKPYEDILLPVTFLQNVPYVSSKNDQLWEDCSQFWPNIESQLIAKKDELTAIIVEPIVQGAGGILIYSKDFLKRLRKWTLEHDIYLIADEIMTGFGRTGLPLAINHAEIEPDFICLAKGLTAGFLPMSAVLTTSEIYNLFYDDFTIGNSFLHSHTHSGNALAAAVALENMQIFAEENIYALVKEIEPHLLKLMLEVAGETRRLKNIRHIGAIVAADLILDEHQKNERMGYKVFQEAIKLGALLRPLGNTIYWTPPLNTELSVLENLRDITIRALCATKF